MVVSTGFDDGSDCDGGISGRGDSVGDDSCKGIGCSGVQEGGERTMLSISSLSLSRSRSNSHCCLAAFLVRLMGCDSSI